MSKNSTILALISSSIRKGDAAEIARLQRCVIEGLQQMQVLRNQEATYGLLIGLTLIRMKEAMVHGTFGKWVEANVTQFGERYANYLMRLAATFAEKSRLTKPELLALPDGKEPVAVDKLQGAQRTFAEKATRFIGNLSLHELLIKHGIKTAGIKAELEDGDAKNKGGQQLDFFADLAERVHNYRSIITDPTALTRLTPQQLDQLHQEESDMHARFQKLYAEAKGTVDV